MERYFIVFYDARNNRNHSTGNLWVRNTDGAYVNNKEVIKTTALANPNFDEQDIVITNIIELNETDFKKFIE